MELPSAPCYVRLSVIMTMDLVGVTWCFHPAVLSDRHVRLPLDNFPPARQELVGKHLQLLAGVDQLHLRYIHTTTPFSSKRQRAFCRLLLPIHNIGYVKSIPSTENHKNGYWWRRRVVWVAASAFLKKDTLRPAYHLLYLYLYNPRNDSYILIITDYMLLLMF